MNQIKLDAILIQVVGRASLDGPMNITFAAAIGIDGS
jgi:hypothetical protein